MDEEPTLQRAAGMRMRTPAASRHNRLCGHDASHAQLLSLRQLAALHHLDDFVCLALGIQDYTYINVYVYIHIYTYELTHWIRRAEISPTSLDEFARQLEFPKYLELKFPKTFFADRCGSDKDPDFAHGLTRVDRQRLQGGKHCVASVLLLLLYYYYTTTMLLSLYAPQLSNLWASSSSPS